jgi:hypothetical protein
MSSFVSKVITLRLLIGFHWHNTVPFGHGELLQNINYYLGWNTVIGRHCFDTSALDGGLSESELMAAKWRGRSTIWQHYLRATDFGRHFLRC